MKLGTFTFPNEPESLHIRYLRNISVETGDDYWKVTDLGKEGRVLDFEGVFHGVRRYLTFKELAQIFNDGKLVTLTHDLWGDVKVLLTQLEVDESCKDDLLRYRLRLVESM